MHFPVFPENAVSSSGLQLHFPIASHTNWLFFSHSKRLEQCVPCGSDHYLCIILIIMLSFSVGRIFHINDLLDKALCVSD